tara:strand:+ start:243 stop:431 length:189 start_codon:yes stop_codon:yes gene_type:complete
MKTFEIEVVRTYTTTIEVELPDLTSGTYEENISDEIWAIIWEKELEQMDTDLLEIKVKELTQ